LESTEPVVVKKVIKNITNNHNTHHNTYNNNTINNYYASAPAPTTVDGVVVAEQSQEEHLFPPNDRVHRAPKYYKNGSYITSQVKKNGEIVGSCKTCKRSAISIEEFAPREGNNNFRTRPAFFAAIHDFKEAHALRDLDAASEARADVERLRGVMCPSCQHPIGHISPVAKACKDYYDSLRKEAATTNDGCAYQNCPFGARGEGAWCVLQGDHIDPKKKTMGLGHYTKWSSLGGVPAMKMEVAKGIIFLCACCHRLEPTSSSGRRKTKEGVEAMPEGKQRGTKEEKAQYKAKQKATLAFEKQQYVDARKREIGSCVKCGIRVLPGQESAFSFDHIDEKTKLIGKGTIARKQGGVSGIVANPRILSTMKPHLDTEMDKCQLMCENCHQRKTNGYPDTRVIYT
jgi:hypothetical protein